MQEKKIITVLIRTKFFISIVSLLVIKGYMHIKNNRKFLNIGGNIIVLLNVYVYLSKKDNLPSILNH